MNALLKTPSGTTRAKRKPYERKAASKHVSQQIHSTWSSAYPHTINPLPARVSSVLSRKNPRDCHPIIIERFPPNIVPRDDLDIQILSSGIFKCPDDEYYAWGDDYIAQNLASNYTPDQIADGSARKDLLRKTREYFDGPPEAAGIKPVPGEEDVHIRSIPNCEYSLRLWGKHLEDKREYCLDFVLTSTGEAINSPFEYELWSVPSKKVPLLPFGTHRLHSLERGFGIKQENILPGEEKFVLLEGTACRLKRPDMKNLYFEVPVRPRPVNVDEEDEVVFY